MIDPKRTLARYRLIEEAIATAEISVNEITRLVTLIDPDTTRNMVKGYVDKLRENHRAHVCRWEVVEFISPRGIKRCWVAIIKTGSGVDVAAPKRLPEAVKKGDTPNQRKSVWTGFSDGNKRAYFDLPPQFFAKSA